MIYSEPEAQADVRCSASPKPVSSIHPKSSTLTIFVKKPRQEQENHGIGSRPGAEDGQTHNSEHDHRLLSKAPPLPTL
jgi:hypothetical protein